MSDYAGIDKKTRRLTKLRWFFILLSFPVFYVLSIGPTMMMYRRFPPTAKGLIELIYLPLYACAELFPFFDQWLDWYVHFWRN